MNTHGPVEPDKDNIRQEPYTLPQGFTWDALDLGDRGVVSGPGRPQVWMGHLHIEPCSHMETASTQACFKASLTSSAKQV